MRNLFIQEILQEQRNVEYLYKEINEFLKNNWNNEVRNSVVWDTCKAYTRGILMEMNCRERKLKEKKPFPHLLSDLLLGGQTPELLTGFLAISGL